jgi:hypothetical protein
MKILIGLLFVISVGWAQSTAEISGTVRDPAGAVVAGADVTATQTETGVKRSVKTDAAGSFTLPNLAIGP